MKVKQKQGTIKKSLVEKFLTKHLTKEEMHLLTECFISDMTIVENCSHYSSDRREFLINKVRDLAYKLCNGYIEEQLRIYEKENGTVENCRWKRD